MRLMVPAATARVTADDIRVVERKISGRHWSEFLDNCAPPDRFFSKFLGFKRSRMARHVANRSQSRWRVILTVNFTEVTVDVSVYSMDYIISIFRTINNFKLIKHGIRVIPEERSRGEGGKGAEVQ